MKTLILIAQILILCSFIECGKKCQTSDGLPCDSFKTLKPGSSFTIASKKCQNGRYPKKENCNWYFNVDDCSPTLYCKKIDIKGKGKKCKGDKLRVAGDASAVFCGKKRDVIFSPEEAVSKFDVSFKTNKKKQGKGFKCTVSCSEKPSTTTKVPATTVQLDDCECGLPNRIKRIVGGIESEVNEYPWQVGLAFPNDDFPICGGSILSSTTILTAAHCTIDFRISEIEAIVGDHDVTVDDGQERFKVCSKIEHPDYDSTTSDNDLSILTLCSSMTYRKEVKPVCLPNQPGASYDNVLATVSGWGTLQSGGFQPDQLMEVNVTTMTNLDCNLKYSGDILDSMICAADAGKDACQGDSGGPLITKELGEFYSIIGVVSWGYGCADLNFPGVYSRVTENMDFIFDNLGGATCKVPDNNEESTEPTAEPEPEPSTETETTTSTESVTTITTPTERVTEPLTEPVTMTTTASVIMTPSVTLPTTSDDCECGVPNRVKRIVGGNETEQNEYPWQVGLAYTSSDIPFCGGSILSSTTILTATHCTLGTSVSAFEVIVGDHDVTINDGEERFKVCSKVEHPDYDDFLTDNDYSVLTLCSPMTFRKEVKPVCLPTKSGSSYESITATVSGWGTLKYEGRPSTLLMEVNVTTLSNVECNLAYEGDVLNSMICATDIGKDACQGDSGGPMVTNEGGYYAQIGIISWGFGCADPDFPGVYARVTENLDFIKKNMGGKTCHPPETATESSSEPVTVITTESVTMTSSSDDCNCGVPNRVKRIVGGIASEQNEYPWQVGLAFPSSDVPFCGGSILSSTTILTATHCTLDTSVSDIEVIVGDHDVTINDGEERFKVCSKVEHPDYDDLLTDNDYAVLTLCSPMTFRKEVKPVCLPNKSGPSYESITATISGWGTLTENGVQSTVLMEVNVTTLSNVECNLAYEGDVLDSMICATDVRKDACQGDSGGPMLANEGGYYSQIGITSWGFGCADPDFPGVYARVTENLDFIKRNIGGKTCDPPV